MKYYLQLATMCLVFTFGDAAFGATVKVFATIDDSSIEVGETTTLRVAAQVIEGTTDNGLYAYALNVLADQDSIVKILSVSQLGDPDPFLSSSGIVDLADLRNIYGGDGGFFDDRNRGIALPFELFTIDIQGINVGEIVYSVSPADDAQLLGIDSGFLLQQPAAVLADFTDSISINVVPEPTTLVLLITGSFVLLHKGYSRRDSTMGQKYATN